MAQVMLREYLQGIEDTISAGHVDDAVSKCQQVLAQFPESLEVQRLLGEVYLARGQMEDAQQALDWILTNDPENVIAYCDRALISERLSDFDTALDCYQQAYELSRGNRAIRQQFNILSAKAGQQGFMFSRAGLARLYMRGGLLPQAVQEWDAVLSVSPDRLDARTGLLETYWREGLYDEAEQLALQTLQDVPGCTKALLLLAHITAPKNMQQAKEYVQRAELLDPDLLMSQELFEDMMMSQPGHPFLKLLKKAPAMLDAKQVSAQVPTQTVAEPVFAHESASREAQMMPNVPVYEMPTSANIFEWNNLDTWNEALEMPIKPEVKAQPVDAVSVLPTWSHDTFSNNDAWTLPVQPQKVQEPQEQEIPSFSDLDSFQSDSTSQDMHNNVPIVPQQQEAQNWNDPSSLSELSAEESWQSGQDINQVDTIEPSWMTGTHEETPPAPPAWLNMLTQDELRQPEEATPPVERELEQPSKEIPPAYQSQESTSVDDTSNTSWRDALQTSLNTTDEEPFFFSPEWLKSLGATELDAKVQEQPVQASVEAPLMSSPQPESVQAVSEPTQASIAESEPAHETSEWSGPTEAPIEEPVLATYEWSNYLSSEPQPTHQSKQTIVNTLEELQHDLLSQGFVPLEPNSLSTIAQSQEPAFDAMISNAPYHFQEEMHEEEEPYHVSTLSSALEQLGNLAVPHAQPSYQEPELLPGVQPTSTQPLEESLWAAGLRSVPAPAYQEPHDTWQETQYGAPAPVETSNTPTFEPTPATPELVPQEQHFTMPERVEAFSEPTWEPQRVEVPDVPVAPAARADAFFESELEATMKRPAVRLQAMKQPQQSTTSSYSQPPVGVRGRGSEPAQTYGTGGGGRDGARRSQERLVKGYQHQLVGDYDEAMQEYRIIIKSAPELLADIVSNVRALLKLAPKYAAGYRVLGDAYMRQGEYLQAMEAYNNALTMAKKAKV